MCLPMNKSPSLSLNISKRSSVQTVKDPLRELLVLAEKTCSSSSKCQYLFEILIAFPLGNYTEVGFLDLMAVLFLRNLHTFPKQLDHFAFSPTLCKGFSFSTSKKIETNSFRRDLCAPVFISVFTTAKMWKQSKCPSTDEWLKKVWYLHTVEHHTVFKKKEIL